MMHHNALQCSASKMALHSRGDKMMLAINPDNGQISAPVIEFPQPYNAASDLLERNLGADRAGKIAVHDDHGSYTYAECGGLI